MDVNQVPYCTDLPTKPATKNKILVTGATGFVGGELIPELVARGYQVRVMVRTYLNKFKEKWPTVEFVVADAMDYTKLKKALLGIDYAYYLIHSLHLVEEFKEIDLQSARNFRKAADKNKLKRIIYLGSLGNPKAILSDHLSSRFNVAKELQRGKTPVTFLRAAIIIGSGSASYKIIKHLVKNCPVFLLPAQSKSNCQPIAISDVIKYLVGSIEKKETAGKTLDIGGQDILTYQEMLETQASVLNKKRIFISSMFSTLNICIKVTSLLTPVSPNLIRVLMESCINDVVCLNSDVKKMIPFKPISYSEALESALKMDTQQKNKNKQNNIDKALRKGGQEPTLLQPPKRSTSILTDIGYFLLKKPEIPTLVKFNTFAEREDFSYRILQRLSIEVAKYRILNIHKIGVNAPAKYIFEELLKWDGDSTCWPNYIAKVVNINDQLDNLDIYMFGWTKFPKWIKNSYFGRKFIPLFRLSAINIQKTPDASGYDNARYLLYKSSGGYPIGVFSMYVRSSITAQQEVEQSQLFLMVGFNFYGKENWSKISFINRIWESIHDRVTSHVLNKLKQLSEWRFEEIKKG